MGSSRGLYNNGWSRCIKVLNKQQMKFIIYIYYRLYSFSYETNAKEKHAHAILMFHAIVFGLFLIAIRGWGLRIFGYDILFFWKTNDFYLRRFIIIPLTLLPFSLVMFLFYQLRKEYFWRVFNSFLNETPKQHLRGTVLFWLFEIGMIGSVILSLVV